MKEMKVFNIDGIKVSIPMDLFKEACRVYVLEEGDTEEERYGNYICLKNAIIAGNTPTLDDLGKIHISDIKKQCSEKEISETVQYVIRKEIKINGGNYEI